jgi:molybdenum cofactor biosynthesis enzyme MoaA
MDKGTAGAQVDWGQSVVGCLCAITKRCTYVLLQIEVRFIEYMPFEGNTWNDDKFVPYQKMLEIIRKHYPLARVADAPNNTSKTYAVEGWKGKVGFISSMSNHFCSSCNRLRLMADGSLKGMCCVREPHWCHVL